MSEDAHTVHANPDRLTVVADEVAKFGCVDLGSRRKGPASTSGFDLLVGTSWMAVFPEPSRFQRSSSG